MSEKKRRRLLRAGLVLPIVLTTVGTASGASVAFADDAPAPSVSSSPAASPTASDAGQDQAGQDQPADDADITASDADQDQAVDVLRKTGLSDVQPVDHSQTSDSDRVRLNQRSLGLRDQARLQPNEKLYVKGATSDGTDSRAPFDSVGYLTTVTNGQTANCSASVVPSKFGDVIMTAAHCLMDERTGTQAKAAAFIPGANVDKGRVKTAPFGTFVMKRAWLSKAWIERSDARKMAFSDYAFVQLAPTSVPYTDQFGRHKFQRKTVEEVVGSDGIIFNDLLSWADASLHGYPSGGPRAIVNGPLSVVKDDVDRDFMQYRLLAGSNQGASGGPMTVAVAGKGWYTQSILARTNKITGRSFGPLLDVAAFQRYHEAGGLGLDDRRAERAKHAGTPNGCCGVQ